MPASRPSQRSILLVEDEPDDVALVKRAFERAGVAYPLHPVSSGMEAIAYLNGDPPYFDRARYPFPALVLLDLKMPRTDGFEVLRWIRHQAKLVDLPVVVLTGSNEIRDANAAYQLGATSFMVKPLDFTSGSGWADTLDRLIKRNSLD
ncbi:MAG TPA: response regulator [Verrucomicrobiae bacterium]|nr:response regulator [Verrucomicrobiae bacterium]